MRQCFLSCDEFYNIQTILYTKCHYLKAKQLCGLSVFHWRVLKIKVARGGGFHTKALRGLTLLSRRLLFAQIIILSGFSCFWHVDHHHRLFLEASPYFYSVALLVYKSPSLFDINSSICPKLNYLNAVNG